MYSILRLCISRHLDHGHCHGNRTRTGAGHETLSAAARHLSRQCAAHSMGVLDVRNHRHTVVRHLVIGAVAAQTPVRVAPPVLCAWRNCLPVALRHHADYVAERAWHPFAVQPERF